MNITYRSFLLIAASMFVARMPAAYADPTTLRLADSLPSGHIIHRVVTYPFIEALEKASNGQIHIQHFPGEQLGKAKDLLTLTQTGVADIGYVGPSYQSDKMPLSSAMELPGAFTDYCQGTRALWNLTHDGGYLETKEFAPNHIIPLLTLMLPPYQVVLASGKKVQSLKDLSGLKVRSAGGAMDFTLKNLDMVPVRMTPPEVYEALSRGTIDGAVFPYESAFSYGLFNKLKSGTHNENFGTVVLTYSIGEAKWKKLPEATRATLMKIGKETSIAACKQFLISEEAAFKKTVASGMSVIELSASDKKSLAVEFSKSAKDWAGSLDKRGKPGTEALAAVQKAISEAKQ
jgi:TRAP-type C4-dicarboxylate transport system substrate-binding protein